MNPVVTRMHVVSAAGRGVDALMQALDAGRPLVSPLPWDAIRSPFGALAGVESAESLLAEVVSAVAIPGCGLVAATTSGNISGPFERWHRDGGEEQRWRQHPARRLGYAPCTTVSVACASGTAAFEVARGWLRDGTCTSVVVAGFERLSRYIHAGFAGLGALATTSCRPFHDDRDGLMLGEGAAAILLETPDSARKSGRTPLAALYGCGLSQDGEHLTAPDRTGAGLARAIRAALRDADLTAEEVDAVSAHGTGTVFNDAMERKAIADTLGEGAPVHAVKGVVGHALGAAGVLEAVALIAMLGGAPVPAPPPGFTRRTSPRVGLSINAAFGGVDAAVVFGPPRPAADRASFRVTPSTTTELDADELPLARIFPTARASLGRADTYVRAGIAALANLGPLDPGTAVVLASETNCRAADLRYHAGILAHGAAGASRLHFPYTIPGAPLAEAATLLGLKGPALVFCDGEERAHHEARRLVAEGVAPSAVALAIEAPERHAHARAVRYDRA